MEKKLEVTLLTRIFQLYSFNYLVTDLLQKLRTKLAPPVVNSFFGKKKKDPASLYVRSDISYLQRMNASGLVEKVALSYILKMSNKILTGRLRYYLIYQVFSINWKGCLQSLARMKT
jgi:hypothetical protein